MLTIASVGSWSVGSGTVSTRTSRLPWKVTAFIAVGSSRWVVAPPASPRCAFAKRGGPCADPRPRLSGALGEDLQLDLVGPGAIGPEVLRYAVDLTASALVHRVVLDRQRRLRAVGDGVLDEPVRPRPVVVDRLDRPEPAVVQAHLLQPSGGHGQRQ